VTNEYDVLFCLVFYCLLVFRLIWIWNGTSVMVRKPPYSFKRLVSVYKVRLNVYKIKR